MEDLDALYRQVGAALAEQLDDLATELTNLYRRELPGYDAVPRSSVEENVRALLEVLVGRLREGRGFDSTEAEMARIARGYVDAAVPLSAISRSFQLGVLHLIARLRGGLRSAGADEAAVDALQDAVWQWTLTAAAAIAAAERDQAVAAARRDAGRRAELLRDLAAGRLTPRRLREEAALHGLDLDLAYLPLVAAGEETELRDAASTAAHRALLAPVDDVVLGVAPQLPRVPEGALVATGPAARLADLAASFAEAREVLDTARAFGLTGLVDVAALGPLTLVAQGADAARRLSAHHFGAVGDELADVERTVLAFLERDQRVEDLAAELHLHRNTIRYRITRFREVTGLDIRRTRDLVTAWWLLSWRQAERTRAAQDGSAPP